MDRNTGRRSILKYSAIGLIGSSTASTASAGSNHQEESVSSVCFESQRTEGESVVLTELATEVASTLFITTESFDVLGLERLPAGIKRESHSVKLDEKIIDNRQLHAILIKRDGSLVAGDTADVTLNDNGVKLAVEDQTTDGKSIDVAFLRTDVDASLFVFDEDGQEIGGSGVTFDAGDKLESFTVNLYESLSTSQDVRVSLYESNAGIIAEETAHVGVTSDRNDNPADLAVEDQTTDGKSIEIAYLQTDVDASLFVFDENGQEIGGSGVTFNANDEVELFTVDLYESLSGNQDVRVSLYESNAGIIAEETAHIEVTGDSDENIADLVVEDQTTDGESIDITFLRTDVDASIFVFDENGQEIGGSGVTFDAGDEVESFTVNLYEPLLTGQDVRVSLYESNAGIIDEEMAYVTVE